MSDKTLREQERRRQICADNPIDTLCRSVTEALRHDTPINQYLGDIAANRERPEVQSLLAMTGLDDVLEPVIRRRAVTSTSPKLEHVPSAEVAAYQLLMQPRERYENDPVLGAEVFLLDYESGMIHKAWFIPQPHS